MLVELATVGMQGEEDTDLKVLFAAHRSTGAPEHGPGGSPEKSIKQGPVVVEKGPLQVGYRESDMLPVAVGKNVALLSHPLLSGFEATGAAGF